MSIVLGSSPVSSGEESDSPSGVHSISGVAPHAGRGVLDVSPVDVAQATAIKQFEERNEGKTRDDLLGFFHGLALSGICGVLKTATRAGRRALRRFAGKEVAESDTNNRENDARDLETYVKFRL